MHGQKNIKLGTLCRCYYVGVGISLDELPIFPLRTEQSLTLRDYTKQLSPPQARRSITPVFTRQATELRSLPKEKSSRGISTPM